MKKTTKNTLQIFLASMLIAAFFLMGGCSQNIEKPSQQDSRLLNSSSAAVEEEQQEAGSADLDNNANTVDYAKIEQVEQKPNIEEKPTCEITITCEILASNPELLTPGKRELIPTNGIILPLKKVNFIQGESVFDVLARATKDNGIHMEFVKTPVYNSAYIEGIHNIYEFDGGEASGWMYSVNGVFPQKGASTYILKPNDRIHWVYSCDLGKDVGGYSVNQKDE